LTKDWCKTPEDAKVLIIGHDPTLQRGTAIAEYCFFANYYFQKIADPQYESKHGLANSVFKFVRDITNGFYKDEEVYITNLCNEQLPKPPKNCTVYIPEEKAVDGVQRIRQILKTSPIEIIFPMSMQVNYWLQRLRFYDSANGYMDDAQPINGGIKNKSPYYKENRSGCFKKICGNCYYVDGKYPLFPIVHVKKYPLKANFVKYQDNYDKMMREVLEFIKGKAAK
jgi:hypothetical protein